jgi:hypothetical protein
MPLWADQPLAVRAPEKLKSSVNRAAEGACGDSAATRLDCAEIRSEAVKSIPTDITDRQKVKILFITVPLLLSGSRKPRRHPKFLSWHFKCGTQVYECRIISYIRPRPAPTILKTAG